MVKEAVDQLEQSTLSKAVKNVKQKLLTKEKIPVVETPEETPQPQPDGVKLDRGIVYLGHIPHGFFEEQMRDYFKQFGKVTRVRLARSKKTGKSRGYGYIEFLHSEVAKIAAESMNNYLMCGRLLKATYIPPEKQHAGYFAGRQWSKQNYPRQMNRARQNTQRNKNVDNKVEASLFQSGFDKISNLEKKLAAAGINYKIIPIEVPERLVRKRKIVSEPPSEDIKKSKTASSDSAVKKLKKESTVVEKSDKKSKTASSDSAVKKSKKESTVVEKSVKKSKTASSDSALKKSKRETAVVEKSVKKIKKNDSTVEVAGKKTKDKIKSKVKSAVIKSNKKIVGKKVGKKEKKII